MKKIFVVFLVLIAAAGLFAGGQQASPSEGAPYADGIYFAREARPDQNGWTGNVTLEVREGKIVSALWNGGHIDGGKDKKARSMEGSYGMFEKAGAAAPWYEQAAAVEAHLIATQDPRAVRYSGEEGRTDEISGATIHVSGFFDLAAQALAAGPAGYGPYKDGIYRAEQGGFDENGYKDFVEITVTSGYIVAARWDSLAESGDKNKRQKSLDGEYGMVEKAGAMAPWAEQSRAVAASLIASQKTDAPDSISGASISPAPFYNLAAEALSGAMR